MMVPGSAQQATADSRVRVGVLAVAPVSEQRYVIGRRIGDNQDLVVVRMVSDLTPELEVPASAVVSLPDDLPLEAAVLVPPAAEALRLWDTADLTLGEVAVTAGNGQTSALVSLAASWYGATTVRIDPLTFDPRVTAGQLRLRNNRGAVALDLSGRADIADLLLESIPQYTRLIFAAPRTESLTIDFYTNVHRKGLRLISTVLHGALADERERAEYRIRIGRAARLLRRPEWFAACRQCLDEGQVQ